MAENTTSSLADLFVSETVDGDFLMLLADRDALPEHPALFGLRPVDASGSMTRKVPHLGLMGYDLPDQAGEGSIVPIKQIADGSSTVVAVRYSKAYDSSDAVRMIQQADMVGINPLAADAMVSRANRLTDLIADVIDGFTVQDGPGSGVDLTVASCLSTAGALAVNNVPGGAGYMGVLHGQQWRDLIVDSGTGLGGGVQERNGSLAAMSILRGGSFLQNWLGIDWFRSNRVKTIDAGANRAGAVFGRGGVLWMEGLHQGVDLNPADSFLLGGGRVLFERDRTKRAAVNAYVMHTYLGASLGVQAGITLKSDA